MRWRRLRGGPDLHSCSRQQSHCCSRDVANVRLAAPVLGRQLKALNACYNPVPHSAGMPSSATGTKLRSWMLQATCPPGCFSTATTMLRPTKGGTGRAGATTTPLLMATDGRRRAWTSIRALLAALASRQSPTRCVCVCACA